MSDRPVVVDGDETVRNENLPLPIVKYPEHYGAFIGFKHHSDGDLFFCSCAREAMETTLRFEHKDADSASYTVSPEKVVEDDFPEEFKTHVQNAAIDTIEKIIDAANFKDRICHKCNDVVPNRRYCVDMYGTVFEQNYGWYINQKKYEYGGPQETLRSEFAGEFLDCLPEDVIDIVDADGKDEIEAKANRYATLDRKRSRRFSTMRSVQRSEKDLIQEKRDSGELSFGEAADRRREITDKYDGEQVLAQEEREKWDQLQDELLEYGKKIAEAAENEVRRALGHYEKGNRWTSETILFQLVESKYGDEYTLERHHRPDWLDGLELDIFIVEADLGIEYQGVQHYEVVEHWGGEEALKERQERDRRTKELCDEHGVDIVEIRHDEGLSDSLIEKKVGQKLV